MSKYSFALATGLLAMSAQASTISLQTTPSGAQAIPALAGGTVLTFDSVASGTYSSIALSGVTFSADAGNLIWIDNAYIGQFNTFGTQSLHNNYDPQSFNTLTMTFSSPVSAFGFFWGASDSQWTLNAYDASSTLIESFLLPVTGGSNAGDFVGLIDPGIASATLVGTGGDFIFIDNFAFSGASSVPEPASMVLLGSGLVGILWLRRRARA